MKTHTLYIDFEKTIIKDGGTNDSGTTYDKSMIIMRLFKQEEGLFKLIQEKKFEPHNYIDEMVDFVINTLDILSWGRSTVVLASCAPIAKEGAQDSSRAYPHMQDFEASFAFASKATFDSIAKSLFKRASFL